MTAMAATTWATHCEEPVDQSSAAKLVMCRRRAREDLFEAYRYAYPKYVAGAHIETTCRALERVASGRCRRLIVAQPRRHSKSTTCTQLFPSWVLGHNPDAEVAITGYSAEFVEQEHSTKCRQVFGSSRWRGLFPGVVPPDIHRQRIKEWKTLGQGGVKAVGVGGPITGRGANIIIIDDPYKGREEADSEAYRRKVMDWYKGTLRPVLTPDGAIVIICTRWHPDDLIGKLLAGEVDEEVEPWEVAIMPAVLDWERRAALWPERYPWGVLMEIKREIGEFEWAAQYMQEPVLRGGNRLNVDGIQWRPPDWDGWPTGPWYRAWDVASTEKAAFKDDPDYTCGGLCHLARDDLGRGVLYVRDVEMGQWAATERNRRIKSLAQRDGGSVRVGIEGWGVYKDTWEQVYTAMLGIATVQSIRLPGDKAQKAEPLEPLFDGGLVVIEEGPHKEEMLRQIQGFPSASHDDVVDMLAIGRFMAAGPSEAIRVFTEASVDRVVLSTPFEPPGAAKLFSSAAYSVQRGAYALLFALWGTVLYVYREERYEQASARGHGRALATLSKLSGAAGRGLNRCTIGALDRVDRESLAFEFQQAGLRGELDEGEEAAYQSLREMLAADRLKISPTCPDLVRALYHFQIREIKASEPDRRRFDFTGDGAFVRALMAGCHAGRLLSPAIQPRKTGPDRAVDVAEWERDGGGRKKRGQASEMEELMGF